MPLVNTVGPVLLGPSEISSSHNCMGLHCYARFISHLLHGFTSSAVQVLEAAPVLILALATAVATIVLVAAAS